MRPDTASSALWAASFAAAVVAGLGTYTFIQIDNSAMSPLSHGQIQQRLAAGQEPAPTKPVEPVIPPAGADRPSPRPLGGKSAQEAKPPKDKKGQRPAPSASPAQRTKIFQSPGGSATATCEGDNAFLSSWAAAFDYFTENVARGPGTEVGVRFDKLDFGKPDVVVLVTCEGGEPEARASFPPDGDTTGGGQGDDDDDDDGPGRGQGRGGFD
jgi:hypothetical protein